MNKPVWFSALSSVFVIAGVLSPAMGVPTVDVGTHQLQPNTPGQVIEIFVTGGDPVQGLVFNIMVANGGPQLELIEGADALPPGTGIPGPAITEVDVLTGTIFDGNNTGDRSDPEWDLTQVAIDGTTTGSGFVPAEGLLARVTLDTTGFFDGTFALTLTVLGGQTNFAGVAIDITDGFIVVGSGEAPAGNEPPTANAGPDQNVYGASTVELSGNGSDPEGAPVTYKWRQTDGPAVVLNNSSTALATFIAPSGFINSQLTFELSVSDGVQTATDSVVVAVNAYESLFTVDAGADQSVSADATVELNATVTPANFGTFSYAWIQVGGPTVVLTGAATSHLTFTAPAGVTNTLLTFEVRAFDGTYEAVDTVGVQVEANVANPRADAGEDQAVAAAETVQLAGSGTDPAGLGLTYLWSQIDGPEVVLSSDSASDPTFIAPSLSVASRLEFELRVSAGALISVDTVLIHVDAAPPAVVETPQQTPSGETPDPQTAEEAHYQAPITQSVMQSSNWTSSTAMAVGIALLILALLLLWFLWL